MDVRICIKRVGEAAKLGINVCFRKLHFAVLNSHRRVNEGRSLFCNNCVGALELHDYGLRFDTPTVNLLIHPKDFVEMLSHLGAYMQADMEDITNGNRCPVGLLGGRIQLFFHHYASFDKAKAAWKHRAKWVDYDNIYAVLVERNGCTYEDLQNFDRLPIKRKVALVHKEYPEIRCAYVVRGTLEGEALGQIIAFRGCFGKRYYDQFDWARFLDLSR